MRILQINPGLVVSWVIGEPSTTYGPGWAWCSACWWCIELPADTVELHRLFTTHVCEDHRSRSTTP